VKREKLMGMIAAASRTARVTLVLVRQGNHEVWRCGEKVFPVPRHREPWLGKGWWRS